MRSNSGALEQSPSLENLDLGGGEEEETDRHKGNKGTYIVWKAKIKKPLRHFGGPSSEADPKLGQISKIMGPQAFTPRQCPDGPRGGPGLFC